MDLHSRLERGLGAIYSSLTTSRLLGLRLPGLNHQMLNHVAECIGKMLLRNAQRLLTSPGRCTSICVALRRCGTGTRQRQSLPGSVVAIDSCIAGFNNSLIWLY